MARQQADTERKIEELATANPSAVDPVVPYLPYRLRRRILKGRQTRGLTLASVPSAGLEDLQAGEPARTETEILVLRKQLRDLQSRVRHRRRKLEAAFRSLPPPESELFDFKVEQLRQEETLVDIDKRQQATVVAELERLDLKLMHLEGPLPRAHAARRRRRIYGERLRARKRSKQSSENVAAGPSEGTDNVVSACFVRSVEEPKGEKPGMSMFGFRDPSVLFPQKSLQPDAWCCASHRQRLGCSS